MDISRRSGRRPAAIAARRHGRRRVLADHAARYRDAATSACAGCSPIRAPRWPAYYKKTNILPITHTFVVGEALMAREPWVADSLLAAFPRSAAVCDEAYLEPKYLSGFDAVLSLERSAGTRSARRSTCTASSTTGTSSKRSCATRTSKTTSRNSPTSTPSSPKSPTTNRHGRPGSTGLRARRGTGRSR